MSDIRCFLLTKTDQAEVSLRRYVYSSQAKCDASCMGYHNASVVIGRRQVLPDDSHGDNHTRDDPRWPTHCACGYAFQPHDEWQCNPHVLYRRGDTGELVTIRNAPVGALWFAGYFTGTDHCAVDGRALMVRLPGGHDWNVDGRARNCDSPCARCNRPYNAHASSRCDEAMGFQPDGSNSYSDARPHKCWIRHGEPPDVNVDKAGVTCGAGAGSIMVPGYHGFLRNGYLTDCP